MVIILQRDLEKDVPELQETRIYPKGEREHL
jgi:hypothetical protein